MYGLEAREIVCPYCGQIFEVVIDCSVEQQNYIEDCEVCCRPIIFNVDVLEEGEPMIQISNENE